MEERIQGTPTMISLLSCPPTPRLPPPCRFGDTAHDLHDVRESAAPRRLPSFLERLLDARSADERQQRVAELVQGMGFDWLGYGRVQVSGEQVLPISLSTTYGDSTWQRRYLAQGYLQIDPRLRRALRSSLPCVWHLDELVAPNEPRERALHQRFVAELRATGMRCGVMLALPIAQPHERVVISLLSRRDTLPPDDDQLFSRVLTLGLCLHEYYSHYAPAADDVATPVSLSPTQRAILQCLARGLADKQIADRLDLSPHTVDYHMRQLRKRFGARNRMQLVPQALRQLEAL